MRVFNDVAQHLPNIRCKTVAWSVEACYKQLQSHGVQVSERMRPPKNKTSFTQSDWPLKTLLILK